MVTRETARPLPKDTAEVLPLFVERCRNPGLWFERLCPDLRGSDHLKKPALEEVKRCRCDRGLLEALGCRWQAAANEVGAITFQAATEWRFVTGLGRGGPLEIGFTFHPLYGIPYIPGSGLKGLARAYALCVAGRAEFDPEFVTVFGRAPAEGEDESAARAGHAVFQDALPIDEPVLDLDVMNPHFPEYYQDGSPPSDWQNPVPVYFLTVAPGVKFRFAVGWRGERNEHTQGLAVRWLQGGLQELGAGAKTAAGYGYFWLDMEEPGANSTAVASRVAPAAPTVPQALGWRQGEVREYQQKEGRGRLRDAQTGEELRFGREAIVGKGWTPGRKHSVRYAVDKSDQRKVVRVVRG